jgi:hypothetical protein
MGVKNLNGFLRDNCSRKSINKINLRVLSGKTIAIDVSIYMYRFIGENALIENMYLLLSSLLTYNITPIFVFDGKPPPEKMELLQKRRLEKYKAREEYNRLQLELEDNNNDKNIINKQLDNLKLQFIRVTSEDIKLVKNLLEIYGVSYYNAPNEADEICAYLVNSGKAWGCLSDDMDMFIYGCKNVLRNLSLVNQTVHHYNMKQILQDLEMNDTEFKQLMILSGTDYNMNNCRKLKSALNSFYSYKIYLKKNKMITFYEWLRITDDIINIDQLNHIYNTFLLVNLETSNLDSFNFDLKEVNYSKLRELLGNYGFIFV